MPEIAEARALLQYLVDKNIVMPRAKCGQKMGRMDEAGLIALNHMLIGRRRFG